MTNAQDTTPTPVAETAGEVVRALEEAADSYQEAGRHRAAKELRDLIDRLPTTVPAQDDDKLRELETQLEEARTIDAGFWKWLGERDLQPDGPDVEWSDIVVALTEHEANAYGVADKLQDAVEAFFAEHDSATKSLIAMGGPGTRLNDSPAQATLRRVSAALKSTAAQEGGE